LEEQQCNYGPVVWVAVEVPAHVKNLASTLLRALGDPLCEKGSTIGMATHIEHLRKKCGVRVIVIDEITTGTVQPNSRQ
jgi:hypothetical protein